MNEIERLTLQDLIDLLADKQNITKKDAETFLREFITLISETIEGKDFVRIKDFGTFKLTPVSARRSVDVNTGDPIEIRAHYKLSFTPDKILREGVNKPFSHFESILIDDDVVFEEKSAPKPPVEKKVEPVAKIEVEKPVPPAPVKIEKEPVVEKVAPVAIASKEVEKIEEVLEQAPVAKELEEEVITQANLEEEKVADIHNIISQTVEEKIEVEPLVTPKKEEKVVAEETPVTARDYQAEYDDFIDYDYLAKEKKKRNMWIGVGIAILVLLGIGIWMYDSYFKAPDPVPFAQDNPSLVVPENTTPLVEDVQEPIQVGDTLGDPVGTPVQEPDPAPAIAETPSLETGAREVEVRSGQTMRALGAEYYGHSVFWVYIFEENRDKIKRPDDVFAGMKLTIAPPSKYGIDPKDEAAKRKAQKQEMKLFGEFSEK